MAPLLLVAPLRFAKGRSLTWLRLIRGIVSLEGAGDTSEGPSEPVKFYTWSASGRIVLYDSFNIVLRKPRESDLQRVVFSSVTRALEAPITTKILDAVL